MFNFMKILAKFFMFDYGVVHLRHGHHEFFVYTDIEPKHVWVSLEGKGFDGCCNAPINRIGWTTCCSNRECCESSENTQGCSSKPRKHKGIHFIVDVETDKCCLQWFVSK